MSEQMGQQVLQFGIQRRAASCDSTRSVIITTEKPVRAGGGVAVAAGAVLGPYMANPVVMWSHDYGAPPIGRCTGLEVAAGEGIAATWEFPEQGVYPLADVVRGLWDGGFINAASIGFQPLKWRWEEMDGEKMPVFEQWELYEFSLVSIPRDREALRRAVQVVEGGRWKVESDLERAVRPSTFTPELLRSVDDFQLSTVYGSDALDLGAIYRGLKAWRLALWGGR